MDQILLNVRDLKIEQLQLVKTQQLFPGKESNKVKLRRICQQGIDRNQRQIDKTAAAIDQIGNSTLQDIARLKSSGSSWAEIAAAVNYSERHCARLFRQAVAEIEKAGHAVIL